MSEGLFELFQAAGDDEREKIEGRISELEAELAALKVLLKALAGKLSPRKPKAASGGGSGSLVDEVLDLIEVSGPQSVAFVATKLGRTEQGVRLAVARYGAEKLKIDRHNLIRLASDRGD